MRWMYSSEKYTIGFWIGSKSQTAPKPFLSKEPAVLANRQSSRNLLEMNTKATNTSLLPLKCDCHLRPDSGISVQVWTQDSHEQNWEWLHIPEISRHVLLAFRLHDCQRVFQLFRPQRGIVAQWRPDIREMLCDSSQKFLHKRRCQLSARLHDILFVTFACHQAFKLIFGAYYP